MGSPHKSFRILIIDDNPAIHQDFKKILMSSGSSQITHPLQSIEDNLFASVHNDGPGKKGDVQFQIDATSQGKEGLTLLIKAKEEQNPYALAFVDIRMPPGWDGVETIIQLWQEDPELQVVICTAFSDYSWEEIQEKLGHNDQLLILKKPFDSMEVRQLAHTLTEKWLLARQVKGQLDNLQDIVNKRTADLQKALSIATSTIESTTDGIVVLDLQNNVTMYNQRLLQMWQIPEWLMEEEQDKRFSYILPQLENPQEFLERVAVLARDEDIIDVDEIRFVDGRIFERYTHPHRLDGKTVGRVWSFRNITERKAMEEQLSYQATHDLLTNLPNRNLLYDRVGQLILQSQRHNKKFALLFFELDRFKNINDTFGHAFGDLVLQMVAQRIRETLRESDTMARMGGDEFVIVLGELQRDEDCITAVQKILAALSMPFYVQDREINITSSIGISVYPKNGDDVDSLLKKAGMAMNSAKQHHPNSFHFYSDDLNTRGHQRFEIESCLFKALENKEFILYYQPIYDLAKSKIVGAEALIRWQHPKLGLVPPQEFIPLAEEIGLIVPIGEWVIQNACQQVKTWHDRGFDSLFISVNISGNQIKQRNIVDTIQKLLKKTKLDPHFLEFELTESIILEQSQHVSDSILALKDLGIKIVIDDFGTGYSSLMYLKRFPIDILKIDRSFIHFISTDPDDVAIVVATLAMAHNLGIKVVAEGVETKEQFDFLKSQNCDFVQGYYFSRPVDSQSFLQILNAQKQ